MPYKEQEELDKAISLVYEVLEKNKEKEGVKKAYEDIQKLKSKRENI